MFPLKGVMERTGTVAIGMEINMVGGDIRVVIEPITATRTMANIGGHKSATVVIV